jgi:cell wall-associated NlpC family hydrolase
VTQTPGTAQSPGTEVVTKSALAPRQRSMKKTLRMIGAGAVSAALVGVFALPAYASSGSGTIGTAEEAQAAFAQALTTSSLADIAVPEQLPTAEEQPIVVETPAVAAATEEAAPGYTALPAGAGASGLVNAAYAQLGHAQDCTDMVQNALAAVGLTTSRLDGGYDMGVGSFAAFGAVYGFDAGSLAPGDILVWPGAPHVAIYVGGGQAVHGGWGGTTVLAGIVNHGAYPDYVVRV